MERRSRSVTSFSLTLALVLSAAASCAPYIPKELNEARTAYHRAQASPEAKRAPEELVEARRALARAERANNDDPGSVQSRNLAYVAQRRAVGAQTRGRIAIAQDEKVVAMSEYRTLTGHDFANGAGAPPQAVAEAQKARTAAEEAARSPAEKVDSASPQHPQQRERERAVAASVSGAVLFESGSSVLSAAAQKRLEEVAKALVSTPRSVVLIGHADAIGEDDYNMTLSTQRAEAVRSFLVRRGVAEDRLRVDAKGEHAPTGDNESVDGRAQNRRVEIVVDGGR